MDIIFLLAAFVGVIMATSRSLGWGLVALFAVGYFSGVIRANYLGVFTTFMFDAGVLGLYLGLFFNRSKSAGGGIPGPAGLFVLFLIAWPVLLSCLPVNHYLVQFVALRGTVWFLPVLLIGTRLTGADLAVLARGFAVLNLLALVGGVYIYQNGVQSLYPRNVITEIIYKSGDISGGKYHRIPSTFLNAHSYGGVMLFTIPFLIDRVFGMRVRLADRGLAAAGMVAAAGGLLMCGARLPLMVFAVALVIAWFLSRFSLTFGLAGAMLVGGLVLFASTNERFQRGATLTDTELVTDRVAISANSSFLELLMEYPAGAGMGSSIGTSVPFFLAEVAPKQVGMENEFSRILVDQGWVGLGGWLVFIGWLCVRPPPARSGAPWRLCILFMYSLTTAVWMTAFIGTGILSSVPGAVLLLIEMGVLVGVRARGSVPGAVGPAPLPRPGFAENRAGFGGR